MYELCRERARDGRMAGEEEERKEEMFSSSGALEGSELFKVVAGIA